ncbi:unnamed protein product [Adineta ricciae]|uniref:Potassium channel tetramerisation-type BTB domain-containing protein n=1 Tax=Adineta ricciae TaxID=249248 RepID=A0A815HJ45_ADIRI|nr:unnamed protein product [Adineta ricciae]CAF1352169.1 unnamed protein product [Adineta ricciae]
MENISITDLDVIQLNVGGELIMTRRSTLTKITNSTLAIMFNGRWENELSRDNNGNIFLDFNPILFQHLLEQLRLVHNDKSVVFYSPPSSSLKIPFEKMLRKLGLHAMKKSKEDIIELNVSGEILTTRQKIYTQLSNYTTDLFVDSNPQIFRRLVNQLREEHMNETSEEIELEDNYNDGICANASWNINGITVAGGNGQGSGLHQLDHPMGLFVDKNGFIYVADTHNHRIVRWAVGAKRGEILVESHDETNVKNYVSSVVVDRNNTIYVCNRDENRIERWIKNAERGETILSNISCWGLALDHNDRLYISGHEDNRILTWPSLQVLAGGNGEGDEDNQLSSPYQIFVDNKQSIYIADYFNHRIMKWFKNSKEGLVVAGGSGYGDGLDQLKLPHSIVVDQMGTMYIVDFGNDRILRWFKHSKIGVVIIGHHGSGNKPTQLSDPYDIAFDRQGNLYVADTSNHRIQKFSIDKSLCV